MATDLGDGIPQPGATFAGKYTIVRVLGEGGVGIVLEAQHERLKQRVALKILRSEVRRSAEWVARFDREARAAVALRGPHVTRIFDVDSLPDGTPYMVMELLEGHDLGVEMTSRGQLPVAEAAGYILQASAAMAEAHALGIIHRDLAPANLFLARQGERRGVKVLDFGISKILSERSDVTASNAAFGTPSYVSPEQIRASGSVDARADIWSLGVILFEMLAGEPPFQGPSPAAIVASVIADPPPDLQKLRPDAPKKLVAAVMKALEKDPAGRFERIEDFAAAIAPFAAPELTVWEAGPVSGPFAGMTGTWARAEAPPPKPERRGRAAWVGAGAVALAIAVFAILFGLRRSPAPVTSSTVAADEAAPAVAPAPSQAPSAAEPREQEAAAPADSPTASASSAPAMSAATRATRPPPPGPARTAATRPARPAPPPRTTKPDTRDNPIHL